MIIISRKTEDEKKEEEKKEDEKNFRKELGLIINESRLKKNLMQSELAEIANISTEFLSEIERGLKTPSSFILWKMSRELIDLSSIVFTQLDGTIKRSDLLD